MSRARGFGFAAIVTALFAFSGSAGAAIIDDFSVDSGTPNVFTSNFSEGPEGPIGSLGAQRTVTGTFADPFTIGGSSVDFSGADFAVGLPGQDQKWLIDIAYDFGPGANLSPAGDFELDVDIDAGTQLFDLTIELFDGSTTEAHAFPGLPILVDFSGTMALDKGDFVSVNLASVKILTVKLDVRGPGGLTFRADDLRTTVPEPALTLLLGLALTALVLLRGAARERLRARPARSR